MGTRGFIGFVVDGTEKIAYNHWDSYPEGLGVGVLNWLRSADIPAITEQARALRVVEPGTQATDEDVERLRQFANLNVGSRDERDWYVLLRETQGKPALMLEAGVIEDASGFPLDSLFAEWGYVVDFDAGQFEAYRGFQHADHTDGRFAGRVADSGGHVGYTPCRLMSSWPLADLPDEKTFLSVLEPDEDES